MRRCNTSLLLSVDYIATKQLIAPALNALLGDPKKVFEASYARIRDAIRALVKRAIKSGDIRKDLDPLDLLRALIDVANVAASPDWQQSVRRLVDIQIRSCAFLVNLLLDFNGVNDRKHLFQ